MDDILISYSELYRILDYFSIGVISLSKDRIITSINDSAEALINKKKDEIIGKCCPDVFLNNLCAGDCRFYETLESKEKPIICDLEIRKPDNIIHHLTRIAIPIYDKNKAIEGCIVIFQDHSAFNDLINRVRYEDRKLKMILDNLDIGVLTVDKSVHITFFNTIAEEITGFLRREVLGKSFFKIFDENTFSIFKNTINDGIARADNETTIKIKNGKDLPIKTNYMALKNEDGKIVGGLATISDLSLIYKLKNAINDQYTFYDMVGKAPAIKKIFEIVPIIAVSDATVLIEGPTGTGKDLLTNIIHNSSNRSSKPMVKVNCAALPDNLLESEMFGYTKGAFTGADKDKPGLFQEAHGSTIFLDEIGDLPFALQAKLLRVLQDKEFYPLGSRKPVKVDVRIISATNQGLEKLVKEKKFREDLFYRLKVISFEIPALKERKEDLNLLIPHILKRFSIEKNKKINKISEKAMEVLLNYDYPGNIRELENILEYAVIICQGSVIETSHLPSFFQQHIFSEKKIRLANFSEMELTEKNIILDALKKYGGKKGETAKYLNIDRATL
ncbi:MAG: sigma 54-interacting transcriptional regulator, partial [Desulfobacterales bacterium]|nr:sigma 54-interacting transcriptional regulator [Desulfobacterales bacterium]